jgi:hypothetical protein
VRVYVLEHLYVCVCVSLCVGGHLCVCQAGAALSAVCEGSGKSVYMYQPRCGTEAVQAATDAVFAAPPRAPVPGSAAARPSVTWAGAAGDDGLRAILTHSWPVADLAWHYKGDYFATVCPDGACVRVHGCVCASCLCAVCVGIRFVRVYVSSVCACVMRVL